ncbi:MAG: FtsX-like permease family protein [Bacteroidales bacterium]|nr:FtsX-like permease family protein [Bacteroidales bacterium]
MLSLRVAMRYLLSKKSHNAVNLLSIVSVVGVAVATAAMVIVLSVFNGFSDLAKSKLSMIDPDFLVSPATGKVIADADSLSRAISALPGVASASPVVSEQALIVKSDAQMPVNVMGIAPDEVAATGLRAITIDGEPIVEILDIDGSPLSGFPTVMLSIGVANEIGLRSDVENFVKLYVPKRRGRINTANPMTAFRGDTLIVSGVYCVDQAEYDADMVIIPLPTARRLLDYRHGEASGIRVHLDGTVAPSKAAASIGRSAGDAVRVLDREAQQQKSFSMIRIEKWVTLLMLVFILIITSFNIISAIYILRVEKQGNMNVLRAMGATPGMIRNIFAWQGRLITVAGGLIGIVIGSALVLAQQQFGLIRLRGANPSAFTIESYPVRLQGGDLLIIMAIIIVIALLTSYIATFSSKKQ